MNMKAVTILTVHQSVKIRIVVSDFQDTDSNLIYFILRTIKAKILFSLLLSCTGVYSLLVY